MFINYCIEFDKEQVKDDEFQEVNKNNEAVDLNEQFVELLGFNLFDDTKKELTLIMNIDELYSLLAKKCNDHMDIVDLLKSDVETGDNIYNVVKVLRNLTDSISLGLDLDKQSDSSDNKKPQDATAMIGVNYML